jgi:hypothetical protein
MFEFNSHRVFDIHFDHSSKVLQRYTRKRMRLAKYKELTASIRTGTKTKNIR